MVFEVLQDDVFGDDSVGGGRVALPPEPAIPAALSQCREFQLHFSGRMALHPAHQIRNCNLWRHRHKHMDLIARQHSAQDVDLVLATNFTKDVAYPQAYLVCQHLVVEFRRPDDVVAVIEKAVLAGVILHDFTLWKMTLPTGSGLFSRG